MSNSDRWGVLIVFYVLLMLLLDALMIRHAYNYLRKKTHRA